MHTYQPQVDTIVGHLNDHRGIIHNLTLHNQLLDRRVDELSKRLEEHIQYTKHLEQRLSLIEAAGKETRFIRSDLQPLPLTICSPVSNSSPYSVNDQTSPNL